ncbi:hypothetical protein, conserved [Eimeria acervulina]|uniref:SET domain-containing protein n=1 Tax=Eimeria acervulina TaxID=5801 RepID=U6GYC7_EIMAC|nr:hypothetical protein, conserved [Eimeria acervulina]CDI83509.1 hypothetical protein, conserved [Eimeria acervulina]
MDSAGAEPLSGLRSLVAKVLGATDSTAKESEVAPTAGKKEASEEEPCKGQKWLSHFAAVAPEHIKRWTNPADGTGNIPYEQLVENLQKFNIPARHASEYTLAQILGVEPVPQEPTHDEVISIPPQAPTRTVTARPHKLGPQAAAYLGRKQDPEFTQVIPVREVTKAFVGPVRERVGALSGEAGKMLKRPAETSEVPPDYVEVVGSKQVRAIGCAVNVISRQSSSSSAVERAAGRLRSEFTSGRPSPIYLEPVINPNAGRCGTSRGDSTEVGCAATAKFIANIPKRPPGKVDVNSIHTKEDKDVYDALHKPVVYTMGTYVWSKEEAEKGTAHPTDLPPVDACFSRLCQEMFYPKGKNSGESVPAVKTKPTKEGRPAEQATIFLPEILEMCKKSRKELASVPQSLVETRDDASVGGKGLFATTQVKKGEVVFVEMPLLTCDIESESMWTTFMNLTSEQKAALDSLQGFHSDLSEDESLWCILVARANKRIDLAKPFKSFLAKMKRNAHGLPSSGSWGLYPKAAMVNHSCEPNVTYRNLDGLLVYFATRDISLGEVISMTYIDQLYASASFRSKRLLQTKCFTCKCTRCGSMNEKERRILCPSCRPVKLKIVDPQSEALAASPSNSLRRGGSEKPEGANGELEGAKGAPSGLANIDVENTSAQAFADDGSKITLQSSDDEAERFAACRDSTPEDEEADISDGGQLLSESRDEEQSDFGEGSLDSDERTRGSNELSDSASNSDRSPGELSDYESKTSQKLIGEGKMKSASGSLKLSIYAMNSMGSRSTDMGLGDSQSEEQTSRSISNACSGSSDVMDGSLQLDVPPPMYCQRNSSGIWVCGSCKSRFTDDDMPIGMEDYFERLYLELQSKFNFPTTPQWTVDVGSLIKSIEAVLGTHHWLYAACNLLLAQLYLGQWVGGTVKDSIFDRSLKHAEVFIKFVESTTREALHVDCAPLLASLMRVLLFNGRWSTFEEWVNKGRLEIVKDCLGSWDEASVAFSQAHVYLQRCHEKGDLPQLSILHRYAHTAQYTITQAAEQLEKKESERKTALEEATREQEKRRQAEEERLKALKERNKTLKERVEYMKAQAAARAKKIEDVTSSHKDGVLAKFMLAGVDRCIINDASVAVQRAHQYAKEMQEAAVQGRQLYPGSMAAEMAYMPPQGVMPSSYLPLIMLDDPLRAIPEKSRQARQRRAAAAREKAIMNERYAKQDLDFEEDESVCEEVTENVESGNDVNERTMIYRIPGLSGTAPGEFVNVSQLLHDEKGNHAPLPLFKSFFYIDSAERRRSLKPEDQSSLIVLGQSGSPPTLSDEKLEDIEAAKYNYLHEERRKFENDVRSGVLLAAAEAGALKDDSKLVDVVDATNKVIQKMVLQEAKAERALEEARYALKGMEPPKRPSIGTVTVVKPTQDAILDAKPQAHTTVGVSQETIPEEPKPAPVNTTTMPAVWEYVPSHDPEKGPTVFLYPPKGPQAPSAPEVHCIANSRNEESKQYMNRRILKPLDFSRIPPPPKVEDLVGSLGNTHLQYKMARINMIKQRYVSASPTRKASEE